jgi:hypothetical protein
VPVRIAWYLVKAIGIENPLAGIRVMADVMLPQAEWPAFTIHIGYFLSEQVLATEYANMRFKSLEEAMAVAISLNQSEPHSCSGITRDAYNGYSLRRGSNPLRSPGDFETSWLFDDARRNLVVPDVSSVSDFEQFDNVYIPGYPRGMDPRLCVFGSREAAFRICRTNLDICTGVTFNPSLGYSVRGCNRLVPSAANEVSWLPKQTFKRSFSSCSQTQTMLTNKRTCLSLAIGSSSGLPPLQKTGVWADPKS